MISSFIHFFIHIWIIVWANTLDTYLKPIVVLQNKAVRLISGAKRRTIIWNEREILIPAHTDPLYKKLNILKLSQIYIYSVQQFVFKYHHGMLPNVFNDFYSMIRLYYIFGYITYYGILHIRIHYIYKDNNTKLWSLIWYCVLNL